MSDKSNHALYSIKFKDGSVFIGGNSFFETKWKEIPNKKIQRIFVRIPGGDYLTLANYDKYYFMIEATKDWARINLKTKKTTKIDQNIPKLEYIYIMGKKGDLIVSYRISLKVEKNGDKFQLGDITKRIFKEDSQKIRQWGLRESMWR